MARRLDHGATRIRHRRGLDGRDLDPGDAESGMRLANIVGRWRGFARDVTPSTGKLADRRRMVELVATL